MTIAELAPPRRWPALQWLADDVAHDAAFGRFALFLPVFAAIGIALAVAVPFEPDARWLAGALALLIIARWVAGRVTLLAPMRSLAMAGAALLAGALALSVQSELAGTAMLTSPQTARLVATVHHQESRGEGKQRVVLERIESDLEGPVPKRVRITVRGAEPLPVGATIATTARLFPLHGPVIPGGYDQSRRLYFDGIGASGFAYGPPEIVAPPPQNGPRALIHRLRTGVEARIEATLTEPSAAFAAALLVGRRGEMAEADVEALRVAGLGHILAISGLHMALVAGSVFAAVRFGLALVPAIALRYPIRKWAAVVGLLAATIYLALSGGAVATLRAYIMLAVALIAILSDRPALTMRTVAVAAVLVMAQDPVSVVEPGFQMSFMAVIALVGAYEWWSKQRVRLAVGFGKPVATFFIGLAATSLIAGLATAPVAAFHFHRLAPLGLVGNLAAMPIMTLAAMPAGVLALALMPFGLEGPALKVMGAGLEVILGVAHKVAEWTGPSGVVGAVPSSAALLCAFGLLWLAILTARWRLAGLGLIALGLILSSQAPRYDLLVSDDGDTVAARGSDGHLAFLGSADGFAASVWRKADGDARPLEDVAADAGRCDPFGCTLPLVAADGRRPGILAVARSQRALAEDCARAEAVVSRSTVSRCAAPLTIDRRDLRRHGAFAARATDEGFEVVTGRPLGPVRAWHVPPSISR